MVLVVDLELEKERREAGIAVTNDFRFVSFRFIPHPPDLDC